MSKNLGNPNPQGQKAPDLDAHLQAHRQAGKDALARTIGKPPKPGQTNQPGHPHPAVVRPGGGVWNVQSGTDQSATG